MEIVMFFISMAFLAGTGYILMAFFVPRGEAAFTRTERTALSFGIGMGAVTLQFLLYGMLGVPLDVKLMAAPWIFLGIITAVIRKKGCYGPLKEVKACPGHAPFAVRGMLAILGLQVLSVVVRAVSKPIESYDAIVNFAIKSKIMFMSAYAATGPSAFEGIGKGHTDYPLLVPMVQTWAYRFMGAHNDVIVKMVYPIVFVAFLAAIYSSLKRMIGPRKALFFTFLFGTMPQIANYATIGYAELTFTFLVTASFLMLLEYSISGKGAYLSVSAMLLGAGMLAKNEGISFLISSSVFCLAMVARSKDRPGELKRITLRFFLVLSVFILPWLVFKSGPGSQNTDIDLSSMTISRLLENGRQIPFILDKFQQELFQPKKWNIFWIMVIGFSVLRYRRVREPQISGTLCFLSVNLAVYFAAYMALTGKDLYFHVNTTLSRFMIHFSGVALVYLALLLKDDLNKIPFFGER